MVETVSLTVFLETIGVLATVIFMVSSMFAMGFSLTLREIVEPLKNLRLVILSLVANFVLVPLLTLGILLIFPLSEGLSIGLILLGSAAGAAFLPKLAQIAKGDVAFAVGLMVLLMVVTIAYLPIVLPLLLPGIAIDSWEIAQSLVLLLLVPLVIAFLIRARYEEIAEDLLPLMNQASNLALLTLIVALVIVYFPELARIFSTAAILAAVTFVTISLVVGYVLGGPGRGTKRTLALGTAKRNIAAALAVATFNFTDPDVMIMIIVVGVIGLILLIFLAAEMGKLGMAAAIDQMTHD